MTPSAAEGVALIGHGTRDADGVHEFLALVRALARAPALSGVRVEGGVLEFARDEPPSVQEAISRLVADGARRIACVPAILFGGGHAREDVGREVETARSRFPDVDVRLADLVGIDDMLLDLLVRRAETVERLLPLLPRDQRGLLLVSSGSSYRDANADVFKAARLLSDRAGGQCVEVGFLRLARPFLQDAVARCARLCLQRVVVLPLFLNTGLLARRVPRKLVWLRRQFPQIELLEVPHIGLDPVLVQILARRAQDAFKVGEIAWPGTPVRLAPGMERSGVSSRERVSLTSAVTAGVLP